MAAPICISRHKERERERERESTVLLTDSATAEVNSFVVLPMYRCQFIVAVWYYTTGLAMATLARSRVPISAAATVHSAFLLLDRLMVNQ